MHVVSYNHINAADDLGKQPEDVSEFAFHSKAQAVAKLKQSFQELEEALKHKPVSGNVGDSMIHATEHYGNLSVRYRLNGLVPPCSRQIDQHFLMEKGMQIYSRKWNRSTARMSLLRALF